jgi:hypothetical protein
VTRSEEKEKLAALRMFDLVCGREGLSPDDFQGPTSLKGRGVPFAFLWKMRDEPQKNIEVDITYFPYDVQYYLSADLAKRRSRQS